MATKRLDEAVRKRLQAGQMLLAGKTPAQAAQAVGVARQTVHPAMMVKVLVYAYASAVFSSRKIERRLLEDLAFRMLAAGNFQRHRTICDFRAFHLKELSDVFVQVVRLAREMGLIKLGTVAIDGTKIKANASRHKAMSYERMQQAEIELKTQIDALLTTARATEEAEANEPELDLPAEIERREARLAAIRQARERLDQRQRHADLESGRSDDEDRRPRGPDGTSHGRPYKREFGAPEDKAQENFTAPDSRIIKRAGGGFDPAYNTQTAVDEAAQIIVAAELGNTAEDANWLLPMIQMVGSNLARLPALAIADAGYRSEENFKNTLIPLVVALGREGKAHAEIDPQQHPHTAAMAARLMTDEGQQQAQVDSRAAQRLDQERAGNQAVQHAGAAPRTCRIQLVCMALNLRRMAVLVG
jgi:transposase